MNLFFFFFFLSWNVRGLIDWAKRLRIRNLFYEEKIVVGVGGLASW
jgi:hypothetical protein